MSVKCSPFLSPLLELIVVPACSRDVPSEKLLASSFLNMSRLDAGICGTHQALPKVFEAVAGMFIPLVAKVKILKLSIIFLLGVVRSAESVETVKLMEYTDHREVGS